MKKTIINILALLFIVNNVFAQDNKYVNQQEFKVTKFEFKKALSIQDQAFINIELDFEMKYPIEDYSLQKYKIIPILKDKNNRVVYDFEGYFITVEAEKSINNQSIATDEAKDLQIPYELIQVPAGNHDLILELYAVNSSKTFEVFFTKNINITKPVFYDYDQQEFNIYEFSCKKASKFKNVKGITVNFKCDFKFLSNQIKKLYYDKSLAEFVVYLNLIDQKTEKLIYIFDKNIGFEIFSVTDKARDFTLHVPYNQINLQPGTYDIKILLKAANPKLTHKFGVIKEQKLRFEHPQVYYCRLSLDSLEVIDNKYDTPTAFGRIFSRRGSNKGKGYPDVYWAVNVGDYQRYRSVVNKNAFSAYSGDAHFTITDDDPVELYVADHDALNRDEFIGSYHIDHKLLENYNEYDDLAFNYVSKSNFKFDKKKIPYYKKQNIRINKDKNNGLSGYTIEFEYLISSLINKNSFIIYPEISNKKYRINYREKLIQTSKQKGEATFFIPFFDVSKNCILSINTEGNLINIPPVYYDKEIKKLTINDDITMSLEKVDEIMIDGIKCYEMNLKTNIPETYYQELKGRKLFTSLGVYIGNENISDICRLSDSKQPVMKFNSTENIKIILQKYHFRGYGNKAKITIKHKTYVDSLANIAGKNEMSFVADFSDVKRVKVDKVEFVTRRMDEQNGLKFKIKREGRAMFNVDPIKIERSMEWETQYFQMISSLDDEYTIDIYELDQYKVENLILSKKFTLKDLQKRKYVLKGNRNIKKIIFKIAEN